MSHIHLRQWYFLRYLWQSSAKPGIIWMNPHKSQSSQKYTCKCRSSNHQHVLLFMLCCNWAMDSGTCSGRKGWQCWNVILKTNLNNNLFLKVACHLMSLYKITMHLSYTCQPEDIRGNSARSLHHHFCMMFTACLPSQNPTRTNRSSGLIRNRYLLNKQMIIDNCCLGLANTQDERFTPFLVIKIKGNDCWHLD
jgi:hypothetical protein